ncbi:hypothetical protein OQA88_9912 [Cercophora sp. LCS_1]
MKSLFLLAAQAALSQAAVIGWDTKPFELVPRGGGGGGGGGSSRPDPIGLPLKNWLKGNVDLQWYGEISLGTPPQKFNVIFDTGSTALLLPRNNCTTCGAHALFNPSASTTFSPAPALPLDPLFGTAGDAIPLASPQGARCAVATDTLTISGASVPNHQFLLCDEYGPGLAGQPADGLIGLGSAAVSSWDGTNTFNTWFWELVNTNRIPTPAFGIEYKPGQLTGSKITLGGADRRAYTGMIKTVPLDAQLTELTQSWVVDVVSVRVQQQHGSGGGGGGVVIPPTVTGNGTIPPGVALLDTGTAFIMTPDFETARTLYAKISAEIVPIDTLGSWGAPCATLDRVKRDVVIEVGNNKRGRNGGGGGGGVVDVVVKKEFMNVGEYPGLPGICQAVFLNPRQPAREPLNQRPAWVFGSPFNKGYYTVWNARELTIGFARLGGGGGW